VGSSRAKGAEAEAYALKYLQQHGLILITQNFYSRFGEIDLIMRDKESLVFVEVRARKKSISDGIESISISKQRKLVKAANYYLVKLGRDIACRFDAFIIDGQGNFQWLKNIIVL
jgi:putative endonuclease